MNEEIETEETTDSPKKPYEAPKVEESAKFETLALQCGQSEPGFCELFGGISSA